jgi:hypothetical protein
MLKKEPGLSSILSKVFSLLKKIIYKSTITQRLQQACIMYPSETDVSVNLWVKDALWDNPSDNHYQHISVSLIHIQEQ